MIIQQLSVFLENRPGQLSGVTELLAQHHIDMQALNIAETADYGVLRLIVDKPDEAAEALKKDGFTVSITKVIGIGIDDQPGGLNAAMELLTRYEISVEYMYAFISRSEKTAYVILRVADNETATRILSENGFAVMGSSDI